MYFPVILYRCSERDGTGRSIHALREHLSYLGEALYLSELIGEELVEFLSDIIIGGWAHTHCSTAAAALY